MPKIERTTRVLTARDYGIDYESIDVAYLAIGAEAMQSSTVYQPLKGCAHLKKTIYIDGLSLVV